MGFLTLTSVSKSFGAQPVLTDVSLSVAEGELLVLVGPSGCGKSTLLRLIAGLDVPTSGEIAIAGVRVNEREPKERDVAMVFQNYALYPHMSVRGNLAFPLRMAGTPRAERERRVAETAQALGLTELLERKPATLSGGQMQRVALGRAIVRDPRLFLFDEPLSNLDAKLRVELRAEIARLHARLGITSVYVTHDQAEAMTMGSRLCVLDGGRVQQVGAPLEVFERPATTFVAALIGSPAMNLVPGHTASGRFHAGPLRLPAPEGAATLGIRPHEVTLGGDLELEVAHVERLGSQTLVHARLADATFVLTREGHLDVASGAPLRIGLAPDRLHWFDEAGQRLA